MNCFLLLFESETNLQRVTAQNSVEYGCTLEMFDNKIWLSMSIAALTLPFCLSVFSVFDSLALGTIFVLALECFLLKLWKVGNSGIENLHSTCEYKASAYHVRMLCVGLGGS